MQRRSRLASLAVDCLSVALVVLFLFPVLWVIAASFQPEGEILSGRLSLRTLTLAHYAQVLARPAFVAAIGNSLVVAGASAGLCTLVAFPAAYSLARFRGRSQGGFGLFILAMKMVPSVVLLVPLVVMFRTAGLTNTLTGLVLAHLALGLPAAVWMLRGYVADLPEALEEAALIDGCSRLQMLLRVVLPLLTPGLLVVATFSFLLSWGEYVLALSLTTQEAVKTMPLALQSLFDPYQFSWGEIMAGGTCIALPVLLIFLVFRRYLVGGLLAGSVKG